MEENKMNLNKFEIHEKKPNAPEKKFSAGAIKATVWSNVAKDDKGHDSEYKTISFDRLYKDKSGQWKSTNSLRVNDIPKAIAVLNKAYEYLVLKEQDNDMFLEESFD